MIEAAKTSPLTPFPDKDAAIPEPLETPLHDIPDEPDKHETGNHWNPVLREQILRNDLDVDDALFDERVVDNPVTTLQVPPTPKRERTWRSTTPL